MPSTQTRLDPQKEAAILGAAMELFAERGFDGTPVPAVAERAGVGTGTIYRYFENKEALVNAVFQRQKAQYAEFVLQGIPLDAPYREQFAAYWHKSLEWALEHQMAFDFLELHHHKPYLDEDSQALETRVLELAGGALEQARAAGVMRDLPVPLLIALVQGAFHGMVKFHRLGLIELTPRVIRQTEEAAWQLLAAP